MKDYFILQEAENIIEELDNYFDSAKEAREYVLNPDLWSDDHTVASNFIVLTREDLIRLVNKLHKLL